MTMNELIQKLREADPSPLGKLDDRVVTRVLRAGFAAVAAEVEAAGDGAHRVGGLGVFRVVTVKPGADGKGGGRRVHFKAQQPKA